MPTDWIPDDEDSFDELVDQFTGAISANPTAYGLTAGDVAPLTSTSYDWKVALNNDLAIDAQKLASTKTKADAKAAVTEVMRSLGGTIQSKPTVTDANRELAGLPVHKTTRTPVPAPTTAPVLAVDASRRLEHIISWRDSASLNRKARPAGVMGLELYVKVGGPAPAGLEDCRSLGMITRSPDLEQFAPAQGGQTAYYIGRWVSTRGEPGPLSEIASATIAALT